MSKYIIRPDQLLAISNGKGKSDIINGLSAFLNTHGEKYRITTSFEEVTQFLGQTALESGGFSTLTENLNYSATRLTKVWPKRYPTIAAARPYANNPQKLANHTYGGRLGNTGPNDGWLFIGRGIKQVTGRANYRDFTKWMRTIISNCPDFEKNPELLSTDPWCYWSAVWYWYTKKVYLKAGDTRAATKAINGGLNGIKDRVSYVNRAKKVLGKAAPAPVSKKPVTEPDKTLMIYQEKLNKISEYRNDKSLSVGKVDGWNGPKTVKAAKAFQKSTGYLKVDGVIGKETREAIDNTLDTIETVIKAPIEVVLEEKPVEVIEEVVVPEIPETLEELDKPVTQNKTLWTTIMGVIASTVAFLQSGVEAFLQLDPIVQIALLILIGMVLILVVSYVKNLNTAKKGVGELKTKAEELQRMFS